MDLSWLWNSLLCLVLLFQRVQYYYALFALWPDVYEVTSCFASGLLKFQFEFDNEPCVYHHTRNPTIPPPWVVICTFGPKFQTRTHKKSNLGFKIFTSFPPTSFSLPVPFAMLFSLTVLSALFVTAWGSMLLDRQTSLPDCALPCITNVDYGSCSPSDNACLCKSSTYVNTTTTCIESSCTGSDLTTAIATAQALCAEVGVTFSSTSLPTGSATSAGSSGSVTASTTGSSSSNVGASSTATSAVSSQTGGALGLKSAQGLIGLAGAGILALLL